MSVRGGGAVFLVIIADTFHACMRLGIGTVCSNAWNYIVRKHNGNT